MGIGSDFRKILRGAEDQVKEYIEDPRDIFDDLSKVGAAILLTSSAPQAILWYTAYKGLDYHGRREQRKILEEQRRQAEANRAENKTNITAAISPARYLWGEALTGGVIVYAHEDGRDLWVVYCISEGACDSVTGIYINGEEQNITRTSQGAVTIDDGTYAGNASFWEEFRADGSTTGAGVTALRGVNNSKWTTAHKGVGKSFIVAKLTTTGDGKDKVFTRVPSIGFVVKGRKITWPGQSTPTWTDNSVAVIHDFLRTRRGIPADEIHAASFQTAFPIAEAQVSVQRPDSRYAGRDATEKRYSANGVAFANEDPVSVQAELESTILGYVYEHDGLVRIEVGRNLPVSDTIGESDIKGMLSFVNMPSISQRANVLSLSLSQSRHHDFGQYAMPEVVDTQQLARDGERLEVNLGTKAFVNSDSQANRLAHLYLRKARYPIVMSFRLMPGTGLKWLHVEPLKVVSVTYGPMELSAWKARILSSTLNADLTVDVVLEEYPENLYSDVAGLGEIKGRDVGAPRVDDPPDIIPVNDVTARVRPRSGGGGTILWKVSVKRSRQRAGLQRQGHRRRRGHRELR